MQAPPTLARLCEAPGWALPLDLIDLGQDGIDHAYGVRRLGAGPAGVAGSREALHLWGWDNRWDRAAPGPTGRRQPHRPSSWGASEGVSVSPRSQKPVGQEAEGQRVTGPGAGRRPGSARAGICFSHRRDGQMHIPRQSAQTPGHPCRRSSPESSGTSSLPACRSGSRTPL